MQSKIFRSRTRQNEMKFGLDWKFEFKKSFELYRLISVKLITKVAKISSILHARDKYPIYEQMSKLRLYFYNIGPRAEVTDLQTL